MLPRPLLGGAVCPEALGVERFLTGEAKAVGTKADFKGRLCLGPFSKMLPWEETEEVDNVQVAHSEGILESGKLEDFLVV